MSAEQALRQGLQHTGGSVLLDLGFGLDQITLGRRGQFFNIAPDLSHAASASGFMVDAIDVWDIPTRGATSKKPSSKWYPGHRTVFTWDGRRLAVRAGGKYSLMNFVSRTPLP